MCFPTRPNMGFCSARERVKVFLKACLGNVLEVDILVCLTVCLKVCLRGMS
jgi:hypothetical protein